MIKKIISLVAALLIGAASTTMAQTAFDGFTMRKGELCLVAAYGQSTWTQYWEGMRKRENLNIGKFKSIQFMPMLGYGLNDRISLFASLPYISNSSDAGTLQQMKGWQDLAVDAKIQLSKSKLGKGILSTFATVGFSIPATGYVPDFLPYSIGLGSKTAQARLIGHYQFDNGWFGTLQSGYVFRGKIEVDRETYYTNDQYYSKEMAIPNVWDGSLRAGFSNSKFRAGFQYNWSFCTSGTDMRPNDMPYPGNRMNRQSISLTGLWWTPWIKGLAVNAMADQVFAGRNIGQTFSWMAGLQYVFKPFQKKTNDAAIN